MTAYEPITVTMIANVQLKLLATTIASAREQLSFAQGELERCYDDNDYLYNTGEVQHMSLSNRLEVENLDEQFAHLIKSLGTDYLTYDPKESTVYLGECCLSTYYEGKDKHLEDYWECHDDTEIVELFLEACLHLE